MNKLSQTVAAANYTNAAVNWCVFKADLIESSEVFEVTFDYDKYHDG